MYNLTKKQSYFYLTLFSICFALFFISTNTYGYGQYKTPIVGHYKGHLDLSVLGNPRLEEFQMVLHKGGTATVVVDEDGLEMESSAIGTWKRVHRNTVKIGVMQFRSGERLCAIISPPDGRADNVCVFKLAIKAKIKKNGSMNGAVRAELQEMDDTAPIPVDIPLVNVKKVSLDSYSFPE